MSTRPRREPTPSSRLLEARAAAVATRPNPPISTPTPSRTLSPTSRELAEPTPVPPRLGPAVPASSGGRRPRQTLRGRPTAERFQTSRNSQWLFKSQFLEDEDELNSSSDLDESNNEISSHSSQILKRPRSGGVIVAEEVAEDTHISIPPPSHQPQATEQRQRHKRTSTTRQTESPDIEAFEMSKVSFKIITSVMVGRSVELSAGRGYSNVRYRHYYTRLPTTPGNQVSTSPVPSQPSCLWRRA
ncbi:uncharacterized protein PV07_12630 [Cladophialophora immunda]|uniref:Uncharacterized protein n=1 Tax=Cladophialophora immunda TaxID=569365 RepID=A0A0D2BU85_9EURO|nr:uncharacterized protein PV07_12630 [Cladophialophora immunda]KIW21970.1 hypothetical protein PV07_12630 [Cladophialophora immunda]